MTPEKFAALELEWITEDVDGEEQTRGNAGRFRLYMVRFSKSFGRWGVAELDDHLVELFWTKKEAIAACEADWLALKRGILGGGPKPTALIPRKWTAADVTLEDRIRFLESIDVSCPALGDMAILPAVVSELVAACWNRLEEKYLEDDPNRLLLAQALEALRTAYGYAYGGHIDREDAKEIKEAIAALEKEVGA